MAIGHEAAADDDVLMNAARLVDKLTAHEGFRVAFPHESFHPA